MIKKTIMDIIKRFTCSCNCMSTRFILPTYKASGRRGTTYIKECVKCGKTKRVFEEDRATNFNF